MGSVTPKKSRKRKVKAGVKHIRLSVVEAEEPELYAFLMQLPWGTATTFVHDAVLQSMRTAQGNVDGLHIVPAVAVPEPTEPDPSMSREDAELLMANLGQF